MENIKDFTISTVFILVASVGILLFALTFPANNGQDSVLLGDERFNDSATDLTGSLDQYQTNQNLNINISTSGEPQASAQGLFVVSETATNRNILSNLQSSFGNIATLLGGIFGLNGRQFTFVSASLLGLFGFVLLYFVTKAIRWGN